MAHALNIEVVDTISLNQTQFSRLTPYPHLFPLLPSSEPRTSSAEENLIHDSPVSNISFYYSGVKYKHKCKIIGSIVIL